MYYAFMGCESRCIHFANAYHLLQVDSFFTNLFGDITAHPETGLGVSNDITVELLHKRHIFLLLFLFLFPNEAEAI